MNDVSDDKKFYKNMSGPLLLVRNGVGDGLFTVSVAVYNIPCLSSSDVWCELRRTTTSQTGASHVCRLRSFSDTCYITPRADRLLMPAFGTASIRDMFPDMLDLASQLTLKWER